MHKVYILAIETVLIFIVVRELISLPELSLGLIARHKAQAERERKGRLEGSCRAAEKNLHAAHLLVASVLPDEEWDLVSEAYEKARAKLHFPREPYCPGISSDYQLRYQAYSRFHRAVNPEILPNWVYDYVAED